MPTHTTFISQNGKWKGVGVMEEKPTKNYLKTYLSCLKWEDISWQIRGVSLLKLTGNPSVIMKKIHKLHDLNTRTLHCEKKLAPSWTTVALSTQRTMIVNYKFRASHSVYNSLTTPVVRLRLCLVYHSCALMPSRTGVHINICTYFAFET